MLCNFYSAATDMTGSDIHKYWIALGPAPAPALAIHINSASYETDSVEDEAGRLASVTSTGKRMIQGTCKLVYIWHWPIPVSLPPGAPHPAMEAVELGIVYAFSSSVALMRRHSVTGVGKPLAMATKGNRGLNINCGEVVKLPSGSTSVPNTVMTGRSAVDALDAIIDIAFDALLGWLIDKGFSKTLKKPLEKWLKKHFSEFLVDPVKRALEKKIKDILKDIAKTPLKKPVEKLKDVLRDLGATHV